MRVRVRLMGVLRGKLPQGTAGGVAEVELESGGSIAAALEKLDIATGGVHLVMVNGQMETDMRRSLAEGDEVSVFPPVAGGESEPDPS
jgi:molybdopterin converting factor small subunit